MVKILFIILHGYGSESHTLKLAGSRINWIVQVVPKNHGTAFASGCEFNSTLSIFRAKLRIPKIK